MSALLASVFLALAGLVKGAIGAGAPVVAIPALAMLYDVKTAVALMMVPNLLVNIWQLWLFKASLNNLRFAVLFACAGAVGAGFGTWLLSLLSGDALSTLVAGSVFLFIAIRLLKPHWSLSQKLATISCMPVGLVAGALQGATGISAPIALSFMNAMKLERPDFMATISIFFIAMTLVQLPVLIAVDIMTPTLFALSALALLPFMAALPVGQRIAQNFSQTTFDRIILGFLTLLAVKLIWDVAN